jgi:general stress protein 26
VFALWVAPSGSAANYGWLQIIKDYFKGADDPDFGVLRIEVTCMRLMSEKGETIINPPKE